ncbi:MAG: cytochrome c-type biogenesis protein CcmH [Cardiobacteriaceae bacterium]|nr:cytochrome c-type biogenesis protein CcmH [Cardiobacteriaceae bacterium]
MKRLYAILFILSLPLYAALKDAPQFDTAEEETRYQHLIQDTRCPTCQNSNIAESNAPLARQLREHIAANIRAGRTDSEITQWLTERYGDFITYDPPLKKQTLILWLAPFAAMLIALTYWLINHRQKRTNKLTDAEQKQLQQWIAEQEQP